MAGSTKGFIDAKLAKALNHPLRAAALTILNDRVASPKEIADALDAPVGNVSYHVKELRDLGCVKLVDTAQRRGATEHYYRAVTGAMLDDDTWAHLSPDVREDISGTNLKVLIEAIRAARAAKTLDARLDRHLSCITVNLDEQGWQDANHALNETLERIGEIEKESAARANGERIHSTFGLLGFESPE